MQEEPYLVGEFAEVAEIVEESKELEALTRNVQNLFGRIIAAVPYLPEELQIAAANVDDPTALSHLVASTMRLKPGRSSSCSRPPTSRSGCARSRRSSTASSR